MVYNVTALFVVLFNGVDFNIESQHKSGFCFRLLIYSLFYSVRVILIVVYEISCPGWEYVVRLYHVRVGNILSSLGISLPGWVIPIWEYSVRVGNIVSGWEYPCRVE